MLLLTQMFVFFGVSEKLSVGSYLVSDLDSCDRSVDDRLLIKYLAAHKILIFLDLYASRLINNLTPKSIKKRQI